MADSPPATIILAKLNLRHVVLLVLLLGLLLFRPLLPSAVADSVFLPTIIISAWLSGGRTMRSHVVTVIAMAAALVVLTVDVMEHAELQTIIRSSLGAAIPVTVLALLIYCAAVILGSLVSAEQVFSNEIMGTFNMYLILGYAWAYVYQLVEAYAPGSFQSTLSPGSQGLHFIYFSFVTLTTVGYGDMIPVRPMAQMLVVLEAVVGQFYVAVVVAYLVSMYITHKLGRNESNGSSPPCS
jgi:voltage-gated potassium channel